MNVENLIKVLQSLPKDAEVYHLWDGEARTAINFVWLSRKGDVITADYGEVCYSEETRPINAPTVKQNQFWRTESDPKWENESV